jgi:CheY-like chemotaxis protein
MDLSELKPVGSQTSAVHPSIASGLHDELGWRVAAQIGSEVASPLTMAIERVQSLQATGQIDRQGLRALLDEMMQARRASIVGQQITRLANGGIQQQHETVSLAQVLRDVLAQRADDLAARGIAIKQVLRPAEVIVDASLLSALLHAVLDWSLRHARTPVEFRLDMRTWPVHARFACRFGHLPPDQVAGADTASSRSTPAAPRHLESLDCLSWRLLEHLALTMQLPLERVDGVGDTVLTLEFPHTANDSLEGASAIEIDSAFALSGDSRALSGSHVLVIATRRDVRNQIRQAVSHMGLMLDFVTSIEAALEFCQQGLPHAIICEAAAYDRSLEQFRHDVARLGTPPAWIEITELGEAFEVSSFGGTAMARVGRDAITSSLPSALMFELARGV